MPQALEGLLFQDDRVQVDLARPYRLMGAGSWREHLARGWRFFDSGRTVEAMAAFTAAVVAAPWAVPPYLGLAKTLIAKRKPREARAAIMTALDLDSTNSETWFLRGSIEELLGDRGAAIAAYEEVLQEEPAHGRAHSRLAALSYLLGNLSGAREHLAAAEASGQQVPRLLPGLLSGKKLPKVAVQPWGEQGRGSIGPQIRIDAGGGNSQANEISASASDMAPGVAVAAWNDFRDPIRLGVAVTLDGGTTWADFIIRPPVAHQTGQEGDPMTAYDPRTGTLWVGGLSFGEGGIFVARKVMGSASFEPSVMVEAAGGTDKPWMAAGPSPFNPEITHLYVVYNFGLRVSTDLGTNWGPLLPLESGIGYLPRVGPQGELYISYGTLDAVQLQVSLDGGSTLGDTIVAATRMEPLQTDTTNRIPGLFRAPSFGLLAVDSNTGRLYALWVDTTSISDGETDLDLYLIHSDNGGATWSLPNAFALPGDQFLPWFEVDDAGRLHLVFLDTRHTAQSDADEIAFIDAYYAVSEDGGNTWSEARLTPEPWSSEFTDPEIDGFDQFIGDYLGIAVAEDRIYPIYLSTQNGDADLFTHVIEFSSAPIFSDGFESGGTSAWGLTVP
ncbi:MAG: tetratricopeptide repeat protein [Deltaproteobacteria bacterium]|nr:tetratricopeptide repeat protein [Deltaproteobacteria bacterium]